MPELMTAPKQFAIQQIFEATMRNPATGELIAHLVNLKTSSLIYWATYFVKSM